MSLQKVTSTDWQHAMADVFWGEIASCDHVVQIYENDNIFLDALSGFVGGGINAGDCCIIIATTNHLRALDERLTSYGIQVHDLISEKRYFPLVAEEVLDQFMVDGWPDEVQFNRTISNILHQCTENNRKVRAFGEMVALLWAEGKSGATVQLEHLWNQFCEKNKLSLFCAYPKSGFPEDTRSSLNNICGSHSKMISGSAKQLTRITYRDTAIISDPAPEKTRG